MQLNGLFSELSCVPWFSFSLNYFVSLQMTVSNSIRPSHILAASSYIIKQWLALIILNFLSSFLFLSPFAATSAPVGIPALFPLVPSSVEEGVRRSGSCGGVVLSCTDKLNRRTVLVRPVSKQDAFSHFSGFFPPVRISLLPILIDSAMLPLSVQ